MDGCSGFSPDHLSASKSNIQFSCGYDHPGNPAEGGIRRQMAIVKKLQRPQRSLQPIFRNKKSQAPYLQTLVFSPRLSSSPDLRIISFVRPSRISPMTGFRLAQNLLAHSGGTVRDLHPVIYSLVALLPQPQALKRNINFAVSIYDCVGNVK